VIKNIVSNITIVDSRDKSNPKLQQAVKELQADPTRKNLIAFINKYPSGKVLFRTAIDKINGSNSVLSPDLVDNLA
jgi:phosphopantothenate synthetase